MWSQLWFSLSSFLYYSLLARIVSIIFRIWISLEVEGSFILYYVWIILVTNVFLNYIFTFWICQRRILWILILNLITRWILVIIFTIALIDLFEWCTRETLLRKHHGLSWLVVLVLIAILIVLLKRLINLGCLQLQLLRLISNITVKVWLIKSIHFLWYSLIGLAFILLTKLIIKTTSKNTHGLFPFCKITSKLTDCLL